MSKNLTTRWYIGAWVIWAICWALVFATGHTTTGGTSFHVTGSGPVGGTALIVAWVMALVMFVMWIGALIRLGQQHAWGWFAVVLVLQLVALGIIGMVAYAVAGPDDHEVAIRPTVT